MFELFVPYLINRMFQYIYIPRRTLNSVAFYIGTIKCRDIVTGLFLVSLYRFRTVWYRTLIHFCIHNLSLVAFTGAGHLVPYRYQ